MKKRIISTIAFGVALSFTSAFAESGDVIVPTIEIPSSITPVTERAESMGVKTLSRIKARGAQLIKERVNSLNQNAVAVANAKGLTADQKTAYAMFFTGKIGELNALGVQIASSTDASSTKALVSSIFTDFRIYAVVLPQVRLQKRIYELQNHTVKLSETFAKIQVKIDEEKAKGKDVSVWQKNLDDAKMIVATDTAKLSSLMTQINALKPSDYPTTSKSVIEATNSGIKSVAKDLNTLGKKVRRPILKKIITNASTTQTTASTTTQ